MVAANKYHITCYYFYKLLCGVKIMYFLDNSKKNVIEEPIKIGDDDKVTKYKAESDGKTFWAYNGSEVFYDDERMYAALDEIARLKKLLKANATQRFVHGYVRPRNDVEKLKRDTNKINF